MPSYHEKFFFVLGCACAQQVIFFFFALTSCLCTVGAWRAARSWCACCLGEPRARGSVMNCHYYYSIVNSLECGFSAAHAIVATWHSIKPVVLFSWFEGPSPKRTIMKVFETSPRSSRLTLSLNFIFLCCSTCVSACPVKVSQSRGIL